MGNETTRWTGDEFIEKVGTKHYCGSWNTNDCSYWPRFHKPKRLNHRSRETLQCIVKTRQFRFLRDYHGDSIVMSPLFPVFNLFPWCFCMVPLAFHNSFGPHRCWMKLFEYKKIRKGAIIMLTSGICSELLRKWMDWFLYDNGLRLERVKWDKSKLAFFMKSTPTITKWIKCPTFTEIIKSCWNPKYLCLA